MPGCLAVAPGGWGSTGPRVRSFPVAGTVAAGQPHGELHGSDMTGPASCGCPRSTAMSARQSPPSGDRGGQVRDDLAGVVNRPRRPSSAGQARRQAPGQAGDPHRLPAAGPTRPGTPAPARPRTPPRGQCVRYSSPGKCLRLWYGQDLRQAQSFQVKGTFFICIAGCRLSQAKARG